MLTNATVAYSTTVVVLCSKKSGGVEVRKRRNDATQFMVYCRHSLISTRSSQEVVVLSFHSAIASTSVTQDDSH